jgi:hypothetical protein
MADYTPQDVAAWMLEEVNREGQLYQSEAVDEIEGRFGDEFVYENDNGNPAIARKVLAAFRKLTEETVVWDRWDFCWRLRDESDDPGRKQE